MSLYQPIDIFNNGGSWFGGLQAGYNYMFPNRVLIGGEADISFPAFPTLPTGANPFGVSIGGTSAFTSEALGQVSLAETELTSGTVRVRLGYAPGKWLAYVTGGFAWTYNQQSLTQSSTGTSIAPYLWRLGWTAGAGVETTIAPHWTARLEYLFTDFGQHTTSYFGGAQPVSSNWRLNEVRVGLNYYFGGEQDQASDTPATPDSDRISLHAQSTLVVQSYPTFRSPYQGANSLPGGGEGRETLDGTLYAGVRLWQGAELWINPETDQGFGLANTHGLAGFSSAEAYKIGREYPYTLLNRYFIRQTIGLGGAALSIEADKNQFAQKTTENRIVLTVGKFSVTDIFDTNKYANNAREQFLNWTLVNAGTFDYAADAWGYSLGAAAEWYQGDWTLRGGLFDLSKTPTGGAFNESGYGLDPTFSQFQIDSEIEHRHKLWGQPGALRITGFMSHGRFGSFKAANFLSLSTGLDASDALATVRHYQSRSGVSINLEQQLTENIGIFARAGVSNGNVEPVDFTDIDRTVSAGVSVSGKQWGRSDDTVGVGGTINGIAPAHREYFNLGGLGILIGDGQLPKYGNEKIAEAYYNFSIAKGLNLTVDYQFVSDPAYNLQRGPASVFGLRLHFEI